MTDLGAFVKTRQLDGVPIGWEDLLFDEHLRVCGHE